MFGFITKVFSKIDVSKNAMATAADKRAVDAALAAMNAGGSAVDAAIAANAAAFVTATASHCCAATPIIS